MFSLRDGDGDGDGDGEGQGNSGPYRLYSELTEPIPLNEITAIGPRTIIFRRTESKCTGSHWPVPGLPVGT